MLNRQDENRSDQLIRQFWQAHSVIQSRSSGKASQRRIMKILYFNENMTQAALTDYLDIQPGSVSEVLGKLESAGLLLRTSNRTDRRTQDLTLTETGKLQAHEAILEDREAREALFEALDENEQETLLRLLKKLNENADGRRRAGKEERGK